MIGRLFRGELSVAQTYWGGFVGFNLALRGVMFAVGGWQMRQMFAGNEGLAIAVSLGLVGFGALWTLGILRAQFMAQSRDRDPSFWSWVGCVLIAVGVVTYSVSVVRILNPSVTVGAQAIYNEFAILNASLPQVIAEGQTLDAAQFDGRAIIYLYSISGPSGGLSGNILLPQSEVDRVCTDLQGYFKGPVEDVTFRYQFDDEVVERIVTRAECGVDP